MKKSLSVILVLLMVSLFAVFGEESAAEILKELTSEAEATQQPASRTVIVDGEIITITALPSGMVKNDIAPVSTGDLSMSVGSLGSIYIPPADVKAAPQVAADSETAPIAEEIPAEVDSEQPKIQDRRYILEVKASPYSFQYVRRNEKHYSKYGFAFELGSAYKISKGLSIGMDVKYLNYSYDETSEKYQIIYAIPNISWTQSLSDKWSSIAKIGAGFQYRIVGEVKKLFLGLNLYLGAGYALNERLTLTAGIDLGFAFQKYSNDLSADAMLGTKVWF